MTDNNDICTDDMEDDNTSDDDDYDNFGKAEYNHKG